MTTKTDPRAALRDLAALIYADLVGKTIVVSESSVKMQASAENLAKLSFKLAAAFTEVEEAVANDNSPKKDAFTLDSAAIASWNK